MAVVFTSEILRFAQDDNANEVVTNWIDRADMGRSGLRPYKE